MGFVQHHDVVEALAAEGADEPFHVRILPRGPRGRLDFAHPQGLDAVREQDPVHRIAVAQQVSRGGLPGERLHELLGRPLGRGGVRFREHWTRLSGRPRPGRPPIRAETAALIRTMAATNPLWGAPRIHGELLKLGIDVAERTVSRLLPKRGSPSQTWRTFLANHVRDLVAIDFFTVPTARLRVLFVLIVLAHHRRRVVHFNVTEHPPHIGRPSRSWKPSRTTPRRPISSAIGTASTVARFGIE